MPATAIGVADASPRQGAPLREPWIGHVHLLRGCAILAVLLVHTTDVFHFAPHTVGAEIAVSLIDITGYFLLISGYLFQHLMGRYAYGRYLTRKLRVVITPYLIVSAPAIAIYLLGLKTHPWLPPSFFDQPPLTVTFSFLATGAHLGPLWFIPMMALFYLAAPALAWIDKAPGRYALALPAAFALSLLIPRPLHDANAVQAFGHFAFAYLLGMAASRFSGLWLPRVSAHAHLCVAVSVALFAVSLAPGLSLAAHLVLKLPLCLALLALFHRHGAWRAPALTHLATISFGLYFVHGYIVGFARMLVDRLGYHHHPAGLAALLLAYAIVLASSVAIVDGLRAIFGARSRMLIGA